MTTRRLTARLEADNFDAAALHVRSIRGFERIGQLFDFEVLAAWQGSETFERARVLGERVSIVFEREGEIVRSIHGEVARFVEIATGDDEAHAVRLRIVPRAHRMRLVVTQEVFLTQSVPDIIRHKLDLLGLANETDLRLIGNYPQREIVIQYAESDLAFLSRLAEHVGVGFYFDHDHGTDRLVFTDHAAGYTPIERSGKLAFDRTGGTWGIRAIERVDELCPAAFVVQDYNYRTPHLELVSMHEHPAGAGGVVEYGTHHKTPAEGQAMAKIRAEENAALTSFFRGKSDLVELTAGRVIGVDGARIDSPLLLVEVEHEFESSVLMQGESSGEQRYENRFRAVDAAATYRPPRVTPKPRIHGLLTAVTEPAEEGAPNRVAQVDDQGRYTVRFSFDTVSDARVKSSAPVRMIQPHAGPGYGMHFPLKPGVEVAIAFVDGDPDRPMIVGSIPNPLSPSPVTSKNPLHHVMRTSSGITLVMKDR